MKGDTGVQTMNGYVSRRTKEHRFSVSQVTGEAKQGKAVSCMEDNRALIDEQLDLLETIQGENTKKPVSGGVIQGRIPNYTELAFFCNRNCEKIGIDTIREKVKVLLTNLQIEELILLSQNVDLVVRQLIEDDGMVNLAYYEQLFGQADGTEDKKKVYHNANDAQAKLLENEQQSLKTVLIDACGIVMNARANPDNWVSTVFGGKKDIALENYGKIFKKLNEVRGKVSEVVTTDYNGDDEQVGVGGYANYASQTIHFLQTMCGTDEKSPIVAIHECAHLANGSIVDKGYVGSPGFCTMSEGDRVTNAAHYEVVPDWITGLPCPYPAGNFSEEAGGEKAKIVKGRKEATDYFRYAHLVAFNKTIRLRNMYISKEEVDSNIQSYSQKMGLTIHLRDKKDVDVLDVALGEDITHTLLRMYKMMLNDKEEISADKFWFKSGYREYFKEKVIKANHRAGLTPENIEYLYQLASK